jgi:hypothetical protein
MRYLFGFLCVCALGLMGCSETAGAGGSGGIGGAGGSHGEGGGCGEDGSGGVGGGVAGCMDNVCPCTEAGIRAAIEGGGDDPYTFDCAGPTTVVTEEEIVIDNDVILDGEGNLTVDGDATHRVFSVPEGVTAELRGLTATHGFEADRGVVSGGGVANEGTLTIRGCVISNNWAGSPSGSWGDGGGILNARQMTIIDTTVTWNSVSHGTGGGIYNWGSATLTLVNSTVSHNGGGFDGSGAVGGGIRNLGELTIVNSTVSENWASNLFSASGGGIYSSGRMSLINSTVSGNRAESAGAIVASDAEIANTLIDGDCEIDSTVSREYNIESPGDTCGFGQTGDLVNITEGQLDLGPLQDNGGPTMTHSLGAGSVAIDHIPAVDCEVDKDQRGEPRPGDSMCDVGAFEVQP